MFCPPRSSLSPDPLGQEKQYQLDLVMVSSRGDEGKLVPDRIQDFFSIQHHYYLTFQRSHLRVQLETIKVKTSLISPRSDF